MSTCSCIGLSTMKPSCRILIACSSKRSTMFGYSISKCTHSTVNNLSKSQFKLHGNRLFHGGSSRILGFGGVVDSNGSYGKNVGYRSSVIDLNRKGFCGSDLNWRQPKVFINGCHVGGVGRCRGVVKVASNFRNQSTSSVESHVSEKSWEKIYIQQGGFNVKPLVIEKIDSGSDVEEEKKVEVNADNLKDLNGSKLLTSERKLSEIEKEAWDLLQGSVVNYCGNPVGTVAACDPIDNIPLNYDQVFIRDFVPSALAFLLNGEGEIVKNFLLHTLQLQSWEKTVDCHSPGQGLMPASFKVRNIPLDGKPGEFEDVLDPDFGESAIGRVAPVDSGLWWIILLRSYGKITGDYSLQERVDV